MDRTAEHISIVVGGNAKEFIHTVIENANAALHAFAAVDTAGKRLALLDSGGHTGVVRNVKVHCDRSFWESSDEVLQRFRCPCCDNDLLALFQGRFSKVPAET